MDEVVSWIIDSGCSTHMTGSKKQFVSLRQHEGDNITFGGGSKWHIKGLGKVKLNWMIEVEDVNYVENLLFNLLSVSQLCNNGKDNLGKFDARSDDAIFLGYLLHSRAYRIFNKMLLKIEESFHVSFDENRNENDALIDPEEEEFLFQVDESMSHSNSFVDNEVVRTRRDDVPNPGTNVVYVVHVEASPS